MGGGGVEGWIHNNTFFPHTVKMRDVLYIYTKDPHWEENGFLNVPQTVYFLGRPLKKQKYKILCRRTRSMERREADSFTYRMP